MKATVKNTTARKAMKAAWTNWKAGRYTSWSECLKSAWAWAKRTAKATVTVFATEMYKFTEKAVCVNYNWYPLSQVTLNWGTVCEGVESLDSIEVPAWLFNKKN